MLTHPSNRDSEESAPAEYPPDQPEADTLDDDGTAYGAEEAELQAALEQELVDSEAAATKDDTNGDKAMVGTIPEDKEVDEASDDGSEDLEEESSESDDEDEDEEALEGEDAEMADVDEKGSGSKGEQKPSDSQPEVMVH
jgi:histone chaperone ASF1